MNDRLDALTAREGKEGKNYFTKIGAAFPNKDGKGFSVVLDAMPAPTDGQFKILLREPLPRDRDEAHRASLNRGGRDSLDDEVPF